MSADEPPTGRVFARHELILLLLFSLGPRCGERGEVRVTAEGLSPLRFPIPHTVIYN